MDRSSGGRFLCTGLLHEVYNILHPVLPGWNGYVLCKLFGSWIQLRNYCRCYFTHSCFALILRYTHSGKDNDFYLAIGAVTFYVLLGFIINDSWASRFARIVFIGGLLLARNYGYEARRILNVAVLAMLFSYVGYLSYIMVPVRAIANPPINVNRPTDPFTIKSYVDREQYGDRPLAKGPYYTASYDDIIGYKTTGKRWVKNVKTNRYEDGGDKQDYEFSPESQMLFPRLGFCNRNQKKAGYRAWSES